jgi:hypothetical protein
MCSGDEKETAKYFARRNKDEKAGQGSFDFTRGGGALPAVRQLADLGGKLRSLPESTLAEIGAKAKQFDALRAWPDWLNWKTACDAYVAAFLTPKTGGVPVNKNTVTIPTTAHVWEAMAGRLVYGPLVARTDSLARTSRAFHWPLEFPDTIARGGFDVVLGNPPWEVMQLSEKEYFASRNPEIAVLAGAARKKAIEALAKTAPAAYEEFAIAKRSFDASNEFARESGRFDLTAKGKLNTYAFFAELFSNLAGTKGRAGIIVPTGIATDATTAAFFRSLTDTGRLESLFSFENEEFVFPNVHHAFRFSFLTLRPTQKAKLPVFVFFARQATQINERERNFTLSADDIARLNPNTRTAPVFRSRADAELTLKIYSNVPVLIEEGKGPSGNPWSVEFRQGLFNMTSDSYLFNTAAQLAAAGFQRTGTDWVSAGVRPRQGALAMEGTGSAILDLIGGGSRAAQHYVPLYEAKMIHQFDHRWATYSGTDDESRDVSPSERANANFEVEPRYWVPVGEVKTRLEAKGWKRDWLIGWRGISGAEKIRTVIASALPAVGLGHSIFIAMPSGDLPAQTISCLLSCLASLPFDYVARTKMGGTNLNYYMMQQLPILPPSFYSESRLSFIVPHALELTYTSNSLTPFARDLGHHGPPFRWNEDRRAHLRAELDALYARAYGLARDELRYILDPTDVKGPNYPSETFRVLKEKEIREHGEYRTARLVLQAWDRMETDGSFKRMDL